MSIIDCCGLDLHEYYSIILAPVFGDFSVKQSFCRSVFVLAFICLFAGFAVAQTASPTPDPFVAQITSTAANFDSFATDINGNGRFVVIESNGDIATLKPGETAETKSPNNTDGNREIFLFDYAQRRIFQITNTKSALVDRTKSATDVSNIDVEVSNNRPAISRDGRFIVFSSNAFNAANNSTPANFDGTTDDNRAALRLDGNQEIFLYQIPEVPPVDLSSGIEPRFVDLSQGTFTRITTTPASRRPQPGSSSARPFVADDNRMATINDRGSRIAFVSTRNITNVNGRSNADGNPEIFVYNRLTNSFSQLTDTQGNFVFNDNPSISGDTSADDSPENSVSVIAFISNADIPGAGPAEESNARGNAEIYVANFNGTAATSLRQVTRTRPTDPAITVNTLSPGRRLSRNGSLLAFESKADLTGNGATQSAETIFIYNILADSFTQVGPRATSGRDVTRFPTFTGDNSRLVFTSFLNFRADGSPPGSGTDSGGLNPDQRPHIFSTLVPPAQVSFTRLTTGQVMNAGLASSLQPYVGDTLQRIAFSTSNAELGGGNADRFNEAFYFVLPPAPIRSDTPASENAVSYVTGASQIPIATPTATPTPTPSPAPAPGFAPGMLVIARSSRELAPSMRNATEASESQRRLPLPVELNGVSVSVAGAAAGLFSVSPGEIQFVVPIGLAATTGTNTYPVVINNNGAIIRSTIQVVAAQPDIFTTTGGPAGRAVVFNVTRTGTMMAEPADGFDVTTEVPKSDGTTERRPTVLRIILTGVRNVMTSQVTVTIKDTALTGTAIMSVTPTDTPGMQQIDVQLPASLQGAGDVPIVVSVNSGGTFTSRPAETAPRIRISNRPA